MPGKHNIPSEEQWVALTKPFQRGTYSAKHFFSGRGDNMKIVDNALKLYWQMYRNYSGLNDSTAADGRILAALRGIVGACDNWLVNKLAAADQGLTAKRKVAVTNLRKMAAAQNHMQTNKQFNNAIAPNTVGLAGGYTKEFASRGVANVGHTHRTAKSASSVVAVHGDVNSPMGLEPQQVAALGGTLQILQQHNLATMTQAQFEAVATHIGGLQGTHNFDEPAEVLYLKRAGKADYVVIPNNGILEDASGTPFDSGLSAGGVLRKVMYVIDQYGSLLVQKTYGRVDGLNFNHSSLAGGKNVLCAGEIAIVAGHLRYINNNSGHYQPNVNQLATALNWFHHEHIPINDVKTENTAPGAANPGPWRGITFVGNQAAAADWTAALDTQFQFT